MLVPTPMEVNVSDGRRRRVNSSKVCTEMILKFSCCSKLVFICTAETPWLDGKHVVFGKVISGHDVVSAMEQVGSESGRTRVQGR